MVPKIFTTQNLTLLSISLKELGELLKDRPEKLDLDILKWYAVQILANKKALKRLKSYVEYDPDLLDKKLKNLIPFLKDSYIQTLFVHLVNGKEFDFRALSWLLRRRGIEDFIANLFRYNKGIDVDIIDIQDWGNSLLHEAASLGLLQVCEALLDRGASKESKKSVNGLTPLHVAVINGHLDVVKLLVKNGVNVNCRDKLKRTPLHYACLKKHLDIARFLIKSGADVNAKDSKDNTCLHFSAYGDNLELVKLLIEKGVDVNARNKEQQTPLFNAVNCNSFRVIKLLVKKGASVKVRNEYGETLLHRAIRTFESNLKLKIVRFLIVRGVDIDAEDNEGYTPIEAAAKADNFEIVNLLIRAGAGVVPLERLTYSYLGLINSAQRKKVEEFLNSLPPNIRNRDAYKTTPVNKVEKSLWQKIKDLVLRRKPKTVTITVEVEL